MSWNIDHEEAFEYARRLPATATFDCLVNLGRAYLELQERVRELENDGNAVGHEDVKACQTSSVLHDVIIEFDSVESTSNCTKWNVWLHDLVIGTVEQTYTNGVLDIEVGYNYEGAVVMITTDHGYLLQAIVASWETHMNSRQGVVNHEEHLSALTPTSRHLSNFFEYWDKQVPDLNLYTCWRMAKKNAKSLKDVLGWLKPEQDKIRVVAKGLLEDLRNTLQLGLP
jgi:hypothetical protein